MSKVELYLFVFDDGQRFRLTSAKPDISYDGHTWESTTITRGTIETMGVGQNIENGLSEIRISLDEDITREWDAAGPSREVRVTVWRADRGNIGGTIRQHFSGVVRTPRREGDEQVLEVMPRIVDLETKIPRGKFGTRCRWALYGRGCRAHRTPDLEGTPEVVAFSEEEQTVDLDLSGPSIDPDDLLGIYIRIGQDDRFVYTAEDLGSGIFRLGIAPWLPAIETAATVNMGLGFAIQQVGTIAVADEDDREVEIVLEDDLGANYFRGGTLNFGRISRLIVSQDGPVADGGNFRYTLRVKYWVDGLGVGAKVFLLPGCDHSTDHCKNRFDNLLNFGGFPALSTVNDTPFGDGWIRSQTD